MKKNPLVKIALAAGAAAALGLLAKGCMEKCSEKCCPPAPAKPKRKKRTTTKRKKRTK